MFNRMQARKHFAALGHGLVGALIVEKGIRRAKVAFVADNPGSWVYSRDRAQENWLNGLYLYGYIKVA